MTHRIALFPRELWSFQVIWGLEEEDASPAFLMELWLVVPQPSPEQLLTDGLYQRPLPSVFWDEWLGVCTLGGKHLVEIECVENSYLPLLAR